MYFEYSRKNNVFVSKSLEEGNQKPSTDLKLMRKIQLGAKIPRNLEIKILSSPRLPWRRGENLKS